MKEQLYTIPVNEAFEEKTECPICSMYHSIEEGALEFTLGPSYMEDDVRMVTDEVGFCERHVAKLYEKGNRLGLALMLKTHADRMIEEVEKKQKSLKAGKKSSLFKKVSNEGNEVTDYLDKLEKSCFVCSRIDEVFDRYIDTVFWLYGCDTDFKARFKESKGFCNKHYSLLLKKCPKAMGASEAEGFVKTCSEIYLNNVKRVRDDLSWFIDKFDYRYADAPWKDSKDALQRSMMKDDSIYYKPEER
ncbi:MAG: DUF6062 family protein [Lachnospiraceae bacterium]|nr:DUF6062 family protein [Lachnospiraceae bacterium]